MRDWIKTKRSADGANMPAGSDWHLCKFNSSRIVRSASAVNKRKPLVGFVEEQNWYISTKQMFLHKNENFTIVSIDTLDKVFSRGAHSDKLT